jgi:DNA-binding NarL/FixJ family response regulator
MMGTMRTTVVIVDDHEQFRASARAMLESEGFAVVGEAQNAEEALDAVMRLRPDILLLDIELPDLDGFEVAQRIAAGADRPATVLMSSRSAATYAVQLASTPACGFIAKVDLSGTALAALVP